MPLDSLRLLKKTKKTKTGDPWKKFQIKVNKIGLSEELNRQGFPLSPDYIPDEYATPKNRDKVLNFVRTKGREIKKKRSLQSPLTKYRDVVEGGISSEIPEIPQLVDPETYVPKVRGEAGFNSLYWGAEDYNWVSHETGKMIRNLQQEGKFFDRPSISGELDSKINFAEKLEKAKRDPNTLDHAKDFVAGFSKQLTGLGKGVSLIEGWVTPVGWLDTLIRKKAPHENPIYQSLAEVDKYIDSFADPEVRGTFGRDLSSGAGSLAAFYLTGIVGAKMKLGSMLVPMVVGGLSQGAMGFDRMLEETGDIDKAYQQFITEGILGLTEGVPIGNTLNRMKKVQGVLTKMSKGGKLKAFLKNTSSSVLAGSREEMVQEWIQTFGSEFSSEIQIEGFHKALQRINQSLEKANYSAMIGGILGGVMSGAGTMIATKKDGTLTKKQVKEFNEERLKVKEEIKKDLTDLGEPEIEVELDIKEEPEGKPDLTKAWEEEVNKEVDEVEDNKGLILTELNPEDQKLFIEKFEEFKSIPEEKLAKDNTKKDLQGIAKKLELDVDGTKLQIATRISDWVTDNIAETTEVVEEKVEIVEEKKEIKKEKTDAISKQEAEKVDVEKPSRVSKQVDKKGKVTERKDAEIKKPSEEEEKITEVEKGVTVRTVKDDTEDYKGISPDQIMHFNQGTYERVTLVVPPEVKFKYTKEKGIGTQFAKDLK